MKRVLILAGMALLLGACGEEPVDRVTAKELIEKCDPSASQLELGSDEVSLEYNFRPGSTATEDIYNCLLRETSAPSSIDYRVQETRPIDGTQNAEWDGWEMFWSYDGKSSRISLTEV